MAVLVFNCLTFTASVRFSPSLTFVIFLVKPLALLPTETVFASSATLRLPNATELSAFACAQYPKETLSTDSFAVLALLPRAVDLSPPAIAPEPIAVVFLFLACALEPRATAPVLPSLAELKYEDSTAAPLPIAMLPSASSSTLAPDPTTTESLDKVLLSTPKATAFVAFSPTWAQYPNAMDSSALDQI